MLGEECLACLRPSASSAVFAVHAVGLGATRLELTSAVLAVGARRAESLTLFALSGAFGQQWLLHHHDSGLSRDVQCAVEDVVAVGCHAADDCTWLLRRVALPSAQRFDLERMELAADAGASAGAGPPPQLLPAGAALRDLIVGIFADNADVALMPDDA